MFWLITGIIAGSVAGIVFGKSIEVVKPIGDIFLNLLFVAVIPLVFFCIASSIADIKSGQKLSRILGIMSAVFLGTVIIAALVTIAALWLFPVQQQVSAATNALNQAGNKSLSGDQIAQIFTTGEFYQLLSRKNMLAMIIFALLIGFGTLRTGERGHTFRNFLDSGNEVFKQVFILIMKLGPIGL